MCENKKKYSNQWYLGQINVKKCVQIEKIKNNNMSEQLLKELLEAEIAGDFRNFFIQNFEVSGIFFSILFHLITYILF